jgi:hypothetical protein
LLLKAHHNLALVLNRKLGEGSEYLHSSSLTPFSTRSGGAKQENAKTFDEPLFEKSASPTHHQVVSTQMKR